MAAISSLKIRIAVTIFVLQGLMMGFTLWQVLGALQTSVTQQVITQEQITLDLLKGQSLQALVTEEYTEFQPMLEGLQRDRRIVRALLCDEKGRIVAASNPGDLGGSLSDIRPGEGSYLRSQEVGRASSRLGKLVLEFSQGPMESASASARNLGILIAVSCMFLIAIVGVGTGWLLTRRLELLRQAAQKIASGDLSVRTGLGGGDEVAALSQSFDQMAARIAADQAALQQSNAELETRVLARTAELTESVEELHQTQAHLVQSEKLAALGSLVAGIAHEINTPVGIGVTAASFLDEKLKELIARYESGAMSRSDLTSFLASATDSTAMVLSNLRRAADLISSFKMVAVDQASSKRREFALKETIEEVITTLRHLVKSHAVRLELELAEGIRMDSYPGPLGQVLTNLVNNALIHAFEGREAGCIRIETRLQHTHSVLLRLSDDGSGIAEEHLGKIFDPFFTTKFGQGGSGLGLNIVHNIVTGMLGGRIAVESQPGRGTTFTVTLPLVAPMTESEAAG